jgi:hypothetical protein
VCDSCLPAPQTPSTAASPAAAATSTESAKRIETILIETILDLFHHWGVVFVLPSSSSSSPSPRVDGGGGRWGDIVLDPQDLADVFKSVIACCPATTRAVGNRSLFEAGILSHNQLESIWPQYEAHLCPQFLALLHDCELSYEIFDRAGCSTGRSLVPALLPDSGRLTEKEFRDRLLADFAAAPAPAAAASLGPALTPVPASAPARPMITRGSVKISFDCLLPNFFPKLILRLRHLTSASHLSRSSFVVELPEWDESDQELRSSLVCVTEERESHSLILYPAGCSFKATALCTRVVRGLLER